MTSLAIGHFHDTHFIINYTCILHYNLYMSSEFFNWDHKDKEAKGQTKEDSTIIWHYCQVNIDKHLLTLHSEPKTDQSKNNTKV